MARDYDGVPVDRATLGSLINALVDAGVDPTEGDNPDMEQMALKVVEQPNYPLVTTIEAVEVRGDTIYLHLNSATDYYSSVEDDERNAEEMED